MAEALKLVSPKVDTSRKRHDSFAVAQITLETGENLPVLVRSADWIPTRVPVRWAVRRRRFECMENTLSRDLRGLALLYEWAATTLKVDLDDMLERSEIPPRAAARDAYSLLATEDNVTNQFQLSRKCRDQSTLHPLLPDVGGRPGQSG